MTDGFDPAYVMSNTKDFHFFVIITKGISAVLPRRNDVELGDFYEVKYAYNEKSNDKHNAVHCITQYRPIEPLAPVRLNTDERDQTHVILTTRAKFQKMLPWDKKSLANLYNESFGNFIDLNTLVRRTDQLIEFEFKCMKSPLDRRSAIFVPTKILGYSDDSPPTAELSRSEPSYRTVVGFVCSRPQQGGRLFVWSKHLHRDALLDEQFCPPYEDVAARWVEIVINEEDNHIVDTVKIVNNLFPTRIMYSVPEVLATFRHDGYNSSKNYNMYYHEYFGLIGDPQGLISYIDNEGLYTGWIVRQKTDIPNCRWEISPKQDPPLLENGRQSRHGTVQNGNRPDSRLSRGSFQASSQPVYGNVPQYPETFARCDNFASSSEVLESHFSYPLSYQDNNQGHYRSRTPSSRALTTDTEDEGIDDSNLNSLQSNVVRNVDSSPDDVTPANRRQRASSRNNIDRESDSENDDELNYLDDERESLNKPSQHQQLSRPPILGMTTPSRDDHASFSSYETPMTHPGNSALKTKTNPSSSQKPEITVEQENRRLKLKIKQISELVKFFIEEPDVKNAMQVCDVEQYEELLRLSQN